MSTVNSFDVFDTLLARRVQTPHDIFTIIETTFPFPNFKHYRCVAEYSSDGTFDRIYEKFRELTGCSQDICNRLKEFEVKTEIDNSYLIATNCNRVRDGDILVSDMYFTEEIIMRILRAHGFAKNVTLYVTQGGKRNGTIWPRLKEKYTINLHLGDNLESDIKMAGEAGIPAEHTSIHEFNATEQFFIKHGYTQFGLFIREFRHQNPYPVNTNNYELYNDQAIFNIPLLVLCSYSLHAMIKAENRTTLVMIMRDCCLLKYIFPLLFSDIECRELQSSRNVNLNPNQEYKDYLKAIYNPDSCLLFDLYGSFHSGRELFKELFGAYPRIHLLGCNTLKSSDVSPVYEGLTYTSSNNYENFNIDSDGSMLRLENGAFVRIPIIEYEIEDALVYRKTVESFVTFARGQMPKLDSTLLHHFCSEIKRSHHVRIRPRNMAQEYIQNFIRIGWACAHQPLSAIADVLSVSKGGAVGCGHRYTDYYETILSPWHNKPISILEVGLWRYKVYSIPSLYMWKAYMHKDSKIYGFDCLHDFKIYTNSLENLQIYTGDQRNPADIAQCLENTYDLVSDDGDHDSKSQQIMFKTVWSSLAKGGYYCIESLHWQPHNDTGKKTAALFLEWKSGVPTSSEFITEAESAAIFPEIESIQFYPSKSLKWDKEVIKNAFCVIRKK